MKANAITAASEATCLLLSVDETVKNPRSLKASVIQSHKNPKANQFLAGLDRVQTRWEVVCQEGWAGAGEDQCKQENYCCCSHLRLSGLLTP